MAYPTKFMLDSLDGNLGRAWDNMEAIKKDISDPDVVQKINSFQMSIETFRRDILYRIPYTCPYDKSQIIFERR